MRLPPIPIQPRYSETGPFPALRQEVRQVGFSCQIGTDQTSLPDANVGVSIAFRPLRDVRVLAITVFRPHRQAAHARHFAIPENSHNKVNNA